MQIDVDMLHKMRETVRTLLSSNCIPTQNAQLVFPLPLHFGSVERHAQSAQLA